MVHAILFALILLLSPQAEAKKMRKMKCGSFQPVQFTPATIDVKNPDGTETKGYAIKRAKVRRFQLDAGDTPTVILDTETQKACTVDVGVLSGETGDVYYLNRSNRILYRSRGASDNRVFMVEPETCRVIWHSRLNLGNEVKAQSVEIKASCGECEEKGSFDGVCDCQSAEVWSSSDICSWKMDEEASSKLTKKTLKVAFVGNKKVQDAKSKKAKLVE